MIDFAFQGVGCSLCSSGTPYLDIDVSASDSAGDLESGGGHAQEQRGHHHRDHGRQQAEKMTTLG